MEWTDDIAKKVRSTRFNCRISKNQILEVFKSRDIVATQEKINLLPNSSQNVAEKYFIILSDKGLTTALEYDDKLLLLILSLKMIH